LRYSEVILSADRFNRWRSLKASDDAIEPVGGERGPFAGGLQFSGISDAFPGVETTIRYSNSGACYRAPPLTKSTGSFHRLKLFSLRRITARPDRQWAVNWAPLYCEGFAGLENSANIPVENGLIPSPWVKILGGFEPA
jgi:hypothetical protein